MFGKKSWKRRWFVVDKAARTIAYYDSDIAQGAGAMPLKPALSLVGSTINIEGNGSSEGGVPFWPVSRRK